MSLGGMTIIRFYERFMIESSLHKNPIAKTSRHRKGCPRVEGIRMRNQRGRPSSEVPNLAHRLNALVEELQVKESIAPAARRRGVIEPKKDTTTFRIVERKGVLMVEDDS